MFYALLKGNKKTPDEMVCVIAFDAGKAVVLTERGDVRALELSELTIPDANKVTPHSDWPRVAEG